MTKARSRTWWKQNIEMANNAKFCGFMRPNANIVKGCIFEATTFSAEGIYLHAQKAYEHLKNEVVLMPVGKSIEIADSTRWVIYLKKVA